MHQRWVKSGDLGATRLLWLFAILSVVFVVLLAVAPAKSHFREWRDAQKRYNQVAAARGMPPIEVGIKQLWIPDLKVTDRCTSCHLGMASTAEPLPEVPLFAAHPPIPHDPADLGCTICHSGQGLATSQQAAHGDVKHWEQPLLGRPNFQAGCGSCHAGLPTPSVASAQRGEALFRRQDCTACHVVDGVGRGTGPDLSFAGLKGFDARWYDRHLERHTAAQDPAWKTSFAPIAPADLAVLTAYLKTLSGASELQRGKMLAEASGCRGCHTIQGVGGTEGPDLTREALVSFDRMSFAGVRGPHTRETWLEEHFLDPGRVVPASKMPDQDFTREQAQSLTRYMLSLRPREGNEAYWPRDRLRVARMGEREFATDGATIFASFCSGCHGPSGQGRRYGNNPNVAPAIGRPDFLRQASDEFLRENIRRGRPGRQMPSWGTMETGLRPEEIDSVVAHLRSLGPEHQPPQTQQLAAGRADAGERLYKESCAGCHGPAAQGAEAPALANSVLLDTASDAFLAQTIRQGRPGTSMRAFAAAQPGFPVLSDQQVADIITFIRSLGARSQAPSPTE